MTTERKVRGGRIMRRALRIRQHHENPLYLFSLTAKEILEVADISRVGRDEGGKLIGYQRPEVRRHIQDIVDYLDGDTVIFPNSIILALSPRVRFRQSRGPLVGDGRAEAGVLEIPLSDQNGNGKPGWIVDGQQRAVALSRAQRSDLLVPLSTFLGVTVALPRDTFLRVNTPGRVAYR